MLNIEDIKENLLNLNKARVTLDDLYIIASSNDNLMANKLKTIYYNSFYKAVNNLLEDGIITKCGKNTNKKSNELYLKYNIVKEKEKIKLSKEDLSFIAALNSKINTSYYLNHPEEFLNDKKYIKIINDFLNKTSEKESTEFISINERSYELFKDEKFLKGGKDIASIGENILKKLNISYSDIYCYKNYKPMLMLTLPNYFMSDKRNVLIVENLDTYWTINKLLMEGININERIDMLIYGQGNAITGDFVHYSRYGITDKDTIFYFGDIDNHGLFIFNTFKEKFKNLNVKLAGSWYDLMLGVSDLESLNPVRTEKQSKLDEEELDDILLDMSCESSKIIKDILHQDKYIPQEVLNFGYLKEKYKTERSFEIE